LRMNCGGCGERI